MRTGVTKVEKEKLNNIVECLKNFERFLGEKDWFAGDHVTIADLSILATVATYTVSFIIIIKAFIITLIYLILRLWDQV